MINERLMYFLESNSRLNPFQSGFRKNRSTLDHLVNLETWIREGFVKGEHVVAIFFDLEKAYDMTWKYGILKDLHNVGLRGRLPIFIQRFLSNRHFRVRCGSTYSNIFDQENGVPQGSILSVTLFGLKINDITKCMTPGTDCSVFVDDFMALYRSRQMRSIERQLQHGLNNLQSWADNNGFKFSETKTVCIHFCNSRKLHPDPVLTLYNQNIVVVKEVKFLGIIFDNKLSFIPHLKYLRTKCARALNLMRVVGHKDWGANSETLLTLYRSLIRSKLDYGCVVYGSAKKSYIQMLDPIQNQALRISLGAFRTSPTESLQSEANEPPLQLRRQKLSIQFALKLFSTKDNPAFQPTFNPRYTQQFISKPNATPPFGIRLQKYIQNYNMNF